MASVLGGMRAVLLGGLAAMGLATGAAQAAQQGLNALVSSAAPATGTCSWSTPRQIAGVQTGCSTSAVWASARDWPMWSILRVLHLPRLVMQGRFRRYPRTPVYLPNTRIRMCPTTASSIRLRSGRQRKATSLSHS